MGRQGEGKRACRLPPALGCRLPPALGVQATPSLDPLPSPWRAVGPTLTSHSPQHPAPMKARRAHANLPTHHQKPTMPSARGGL